MKSRFILSLAAAGTVLTSGCASTEDNKAAAAAPPRAQRGESMTGSHIPNKNPLPEQSDVEREKTVERVRELQKTSPPVQTKP